MALFTGSAAGAVDLITRGVEAEFRRLLLEKFGAIANELAREAAKEAAQNVIGRVEAVKDFRSDSMQVHVTFDSKPL